MGNRKSFDNTLLASLRNDVEKYISRKIISPADFIFLSDTLQQQGYGYVSPTTLKRVWGYISDKGESYVPSNYTLRALSGMLGFKDWSEYCNNSSAIQSMEYTGQFIETRFLPLNTEISLLWQPNRRIRLRHIKPSLFEVIENEHSRLHIGDVVECSCFTQHAPAFFRVFRQNITPISYIAGSTQGIIYVVHSAASAEP